MWVVVSRGCLRVFSLVNATLSCSFLFSCCSMNTLTFNLSVDVHVGPSPSSTSVFPRFNPTAIFKTSPGTLIFLGWPLNLFSKCAVICCWPPSIFLFLFLFGFFCQSCDKTWRILLLISQHPLRKRPSEDGAAGVTGEKAAQGFLQERLISTFRNTRQVTV